MSDLTPQNYANHVRNDKAAYAIAGLSILSLLLLIVGIFVPILTTVGLVLLAVLFLAFQGKTRVYALTVQDRVIRLEMQVRLERVLSDDLREATRSLPLKQLIALRFASDEELPGLVQKVLAGELPTGDSIKRAVTDWQPDTQRV
jgi:hypothetical protein